jgi:hypothetical protein
MGTASEKITSCKTALDYAGKFGWLVFPCKPWPDKSPLTRNGWWDASKAPATIAAWWERSPQALIGVPTGKASGFVVLDIDVKDPHANGFDTLGNKLGLPTLPPTRMVHTASGGLHLHLDPGEHTICNTAGGRGRGIGPGLDWRGEGGYVIVPSRLAPEPDPDNPGYWWDPVCGPETPLAPVPAALLPRAPERKPRKPVAAADGLSPYARAALDGACRRIVRAANGAQEATLNSECFAIGTLAGADAIPEHFALEVLVWTASQIPDYDPRRPWRAAELENKVRRAFDAGVSRPRQRRHG